MPAVVAALERRRAMVAHTRGRFLAVALTSLLLSRSAFGPQPGILRFLWSSWTALWGPNGAELNPNGATTGDNGAELDPDGR
jgi:hypothetical protein